MTDVTTASGQEFITLSADEQLAYAEKYRARHGFYPIAGGETAEAAPADVQPDSATGQGGEQGAQGDGATADAKGTEGGFNWGLFPEVPESQRPLLEPHLKKVQAHVTKLEQQLASFKDVQPEQVQQLVQFEQAFNQSPIDTWVSMAEQMQKNGLMTELDIDAVRAIANGEDIEDEEPAAGAPSGTEEGGEGEDPRIAELRAEIDALKQERQQEVQTRQQRQEKQLLDRSLQSMREQLKEAGVDEVDDKVLVGHLIATNGDQEAALKAMTGFREGTLKSFAEKSKNGKEGPDMPKGAPKAPEQKKGDSWRQATDGAMNYLKHAQGQS